MTEKRTMTLLEATNWFADHMVSPYQHEICIFCQGHALHHSSYCDYAAACRAIDTAKRKKSTEHLAITLVQRVPDAAWFERQIRATDPHIDVLPDLYVGALAAHLRGNLSVNTDAVLVDGPTLLAMLEGVVAPNRADRAGWRAPAEAMLESLKEAQP